MVGSLSEIELTPGVKAVSYYALQKDLRHYTELISTRFILTIGG
jgi:DNA segregation ATPase FtsK/SpoIIIE-like protein